MVTPYSVLGIFFFLSQITILHHFSCYHCQIVEKSLCKFSDTLSLEFSYKIKHMKVETNKNDT